MTNEKERFELLLEHLESKIDIIADGQLQLMKDMGEVKERLDKIETSMQRITKLEEKAA